MSQNSQAEDLKDLENLNILSFLLERTHTHFYLNFG
jgi:hypothetical protein